jgi:hypothetical protein
MEDLEAVVVSGRTGSTKLLRSTTIVTRVSYVNKGVLHLAESCIALA